MISLFLLILYLICLDKIWIAHKLYHFVPYYDSNNLICLNSSLQTNLIFVFLYFNFVHYGQIKYCHYHCNWHSI